VCWEGYRGVGHTHTHCTLPGNIHTLQQHHRLAYQVTVVRAQRTDTISYRLRSEHQSTADFLSRSSSTNLSLFFSFLSLSHQVLNDQRGIYLLYTQINILLLLHSDNSASSGVKYLSSTLNYVYLNSLLGVSVLLYYFYFWLLLLHYIPKENNLLFTPYIITFLMLSRQDRKLVKFTQDKKSLFIPTSSDLADSLNTNALFVNYVRVLSVLFV
jgi:hypothetical protein